MTKVLLVGGGGYLGGHLKDSLREGAEVTITGRRPRQQHDYFQVDFNDPSTFLNVDPSDFDIVIILAADKSGLGKTGLGGDSLRLNVTGYGNFLDHIGRSSFRGRLVYISSMTVYSHDNAVPVRETGDTENPPNVYGLTKRIGEQLTRFSCRSNGFRGICLRIPGLFGGGRRSGFVHNAMVRFSEGAPLEIDTTGSIYWECALVTDIADMITRLISFHDWGAGYETFNLGYGKEATMISVAQSLRQKMGSPSSIVETSSRDGANLFMDISKAASVMPMDYGMDSALDEFLVHTRR